MSSRKPSRAGWRRGLSGAGSWATIGGYHHCGYRRTDAPADTGSFLPWVANAMAPVVPEPAIPFVARRSSGVGAAGEWYVADVIARSSGPRR